MVDLCALAEQLHAFTPVSQIRNSLLCHLTRFAMALAPEIGPTMPPSAVSPPVMWSFVFNDRGSFQGSAEPNRPNQTG
jgi:hypothetical protein